MNQQKDLLQEEKELDEDNNYELDLEVVFEGVRRNKKIFFAFALVFSFFGVVQSLKMKDIWKGEVQIVINDNKKTSNVSTIPGLDIERLSSFISTTATSDLKTQVKILRSSSVLMPAFNYFKEQKSLLGVDTDGMKYRDWIKGPLSVDLEGGTSVLTLNFQDSDKDVILPVLGKISKIYQEYTTKNRNEELSQRISFLESQREVLNKESQDAISELQIYSLENNILMPQFDEMNSEFLQNSNNFTNSLFLMNPYNELNINIIETKEEISFLKRNNDYSSGTNIIASKLEDTIILGLIADLKEIETEIQRKNLIFTQEDPKLIAIKNDSKILKNEIRNKVIIHLNAKLRLLEKQKKIYTSSDEVIYKFRELFGLANRNSLSLQRLENALHSASLQLGNGELPWRLITQPTLLQDPIGPVRTFVVLQYIIYGFLIASFISIVKDFRRNVLYNQKSIQKIIRTGLLEKLSTKAIFDWNEAIKLLLNGPLQDKDKKDIALANIGKIEKKYNDKISDIFEKNLDDRKLLFTKDILEIKKASFKILIIQSGTISKLELSKFIKRINLQNIQFDGWIYIE